MTPDPAQLFSERNESYVRFVRFVRIRGQFVRIFWPHRSCAPIFASSMRGAGPGS